MLFNTEVLVEFETYCIRQLTKCREKISLEENPRIVHLKILSCFERVRTELDVKMKEESGMLPSRLSDTISENVDNQALTNLSKKVS
jgi:hypothetical protein